MRALGAQGLDLLESALSFPNNDFSHPFNMVCLGLNECEDSFDDLGASDSEIVTLSDQFIHFLYDFLVNSDSELLFRHSYNKLRTACTKCTALSIR